MSVIFSYIYKNIHENILLDVESILCFCINQFNIFFEKHLVYFLIKYFNQHFLLVQHFITAYVILGQLTLIF